MPDLLIELFSEEIPARMQARAADDLKKLVTNGLVEAGLTYASAAAFSTPRRLTLTIEGMLDASPSITEERKGPKADAPEKAIEGFLRGAGLTRDQLEERENAQGQHPVCNDRKAGPPRGRDRGRSARHTPSATSRGPNPCAGAPVPCGGCVRCTRFYASCLREDGAAGCPDGR